MRSLTFPHDVAPDPIDTIRLAFGEGRELTAPEEANLRSAFELYEHHRGRGDLIAPSDHFKGVVGNDFRTAYNQTYDKKRLDKMRVALKALAANRCPRCGGSRPGTLDHHLPKADYAEFSVYPMNLLACCQECNGKKSTAVGGTPEEAFLHPYYDVIPAVPFIKVDLEVNALGTSAVVSFDDNSDIGDALLKARMKYQFDKVDVNTRIASEIVEYISEKAGTIAITVGEDGSEAVKAFLLRAAELSDASYTVGSWQSAILRALSQNDLFCNGAFKAMVPGLR